MLLHCVKGFVCAECKMCCHLVTLGVCQNIWNLLWQFVFYSNYNYCEWVTDYHYGACTHCIFKISF